MLAPLMNRHRSLIHFTTDRNCCNCGSRYPAVLLNPNTNDQLFIASCVNNDGDYIKYPRIEDNWNLIEIGQTKDVDFAGNEIFYYFIKLNGNIFHKTINSDPKEMTNLKVYASDPWYPKADGSVKNLVAKNSASQSKSLHFSSGLNTNKCLS